MTTARAPAMTIRARKHVVWLAVLHAAQLLLAVIMVWPLAAMVRSSYASHPLGDRVLFADGAVELLDFVARELPPTLPALKGHAVVAALIAGAVRVVLFGATVALLANRVDGRWADRAGAALRVGVTRFGALAAQSIAAGVAQIIMLGLAVGALSAISGALGERMGLPNAGRVGLVAAVPIAFIAFAIGVVRDVAAARVVSDGDSTLRAVAQSFRIVARKPIYFLEDGWRAATGLLLVAGAAAIATRLGGRPGAALFFLFVIHQTVLAMRIALRVSWIAAILRRMH